MTRKEAGSKLKQALISCTKQQAQDVNDILELGAGDMLSPKGTTFSGPDQIPNERREAYANLIDAVFDCDPESGNAEWEPIHGGAWEDVLATLIIEEEWGKIHDTAEELRSDEELVRSRRG